MSQSPRPAVLRLSSAPAPTCVCLNDGSVMETRTALMEQMRVLRLAAVSGMDYITTLWKFCFLCVVIVEKTPEIKSYVC